MKSNGRGWRLMIFYARATRGLRRPSLGLMVRLGVPVGGRVRKLRAVEDQSAPIPGEEVGKFRRKGQDGELFVLLLAERACLAGAFAQE